MRPPTPISRRAPVTALALAGGAMMVPVSLADPAAARPGTRNGTRNGQLRTAARPIAYHRWDDGEAFDAGTLRGTTVARGRLRLAAPGAGSLGERVLDGRTYDEGTWRSPWHEPGFDLTSLIPSWSARTPRDSLVEVHVRGRTPDGRTSSWDLLGRWAAGDAHVRRTTVAGQSDDVARVDTDTWTVTAAGGVRAYQLRVHLLRRRGQQSSPRLDVVGAVASRLPSGTPATSEPGGVVRTLDVPRYSQMIHQGHYPQWGGGGEAWCSPTSTSMVLAYYDALPGARAGSWVPDGHRDPWVDVAARATYDHGYDGTGNWAFNTAYAAGRLGAGGEAFVTRLTHLRQAERFVAAGIPLVASVTFAAGELDGAPIGSTAGHLLVIVGFTADGDVVVNDPAADTAAGVRRTYDRAQLEKAWLTRSGGLVYVLRDVDHPLPGGDAPNW